MNLHAIYHNPNSNYAYARSNNELHIRLRTAKNDVDEIYIHIGCKYDFNLRKKLKMEKVATDKLFDYYQTDYLATDSRAAYYFEIIKDDEKVVLTENGFFHNFDEKGSYENFFVFPCINPTDVHVTPKWTNDALFYQIFVERFNDGDESNNPRKYLEGEKKPEHCCLYGGDLQGIIDKLDYLDDLGVNGLYLTPIFESPTNHKYDTTDYFKIDKYFGTKELMVELVEKAHQKNIKIVLDCVFNHSGQNFAQFQDVVKNGEKSKYYDWFYIKKYSPNFDEMEYDSFAFVKNMPKINTANKEARKFLLDVVEYWTEGTNIDGWRLDVSDEIEMDFWIDFRKLVKGINNQAIIIGENWHNSYAWLTGNRFDCVMNYPVTKACVDFFAHNKIDTQKFCDDISNILMWYSEQVNLSQLNFLDSHDTPRLLTLCKNNKSRVYIALAFLYSYIGIPCIYYGTEVGLNGGEDQDCRQMFDWNENTWDKETLSFTKQLINIRKDNIALREGKIRLWVKDNVLYLLRKHKTQSVITVINNTDKDKNIEIENGFNPILNNTNDKLSSYSCEIFVKENK